MLPRSRFIVYVLGFSSGVVVSLTAIFSFRLHSLGISSHFEGAALPTRKNLSNTNNRQPISRIWNLDDVAPTSTSHGTSKRQFIHPFQKEMHPDLAGISVAYLEPGETVEPHGHPNMHEFMFVLDGSMKATLQQGQHESSSVICAKNCLFHGSPTEVHSFEPDPLTGVQFLLVQLTTST